MNNFSEVHSDMETDKRIEEDDEEMKRWEKDMQTAYMSGKIYMREKILEFINQRFMETNSSEDSSTTALWNVMQDIKKL